MLAGLTEEARPRLQTGAGVHCFSVSPRWQYPEVVGCRCGVLVAVRRPICAIVRNSFPRSRQEAVGVEVR